MAEKESVSTKWTDTEKLALCISIISASGPPDWKNVKLPTGRTKKACFHVYNSLKKQSEGVALASPDSAAVPKPRKKAEKAEKAITNGGKKRGRPAKVKQSVEVAEHGDDEEDEGGDRKKVKTEEDDMGGEMVEETVEENDEEN